MKVRAMADNLAPHGDRIDAEDLFQIGMTELCRIAPEWEQLDQFEFERRTFQRVRGEMIDHCKLEAKVRTRLLVMNRVSEELVKRVEVGNIFASDEERKEHKRRTVNMFLAAAVVSLMAEHDSATPEDLVALNQQRIRIQSALKPLIAQLDPVDWALVRDTGIDDKSVAESARLYEVPEKEARTRREKALAFLGEGLRRAGVRAG